MRDLQHDALNLFDLELDDSQAAAFARYAAELADWNKRINLTAITEPGEVQVKHFLDSLSCLPAMRETDFNRIIDVGTGAGFPGIPLKIAVPDIHLTLVESVGKKTAFLAHIVQVLGLDGVEILTARAEEVGRLPDHRETYDWALARAVAPVTVLAEYLLPLVKPGSYMLAQKGHTAHEEATDAQPAFAELGGELQDFIKVELSDVSDSRYLVVVKKIENTLEKYPRRVGVPGKRPLE
ncbi:MAG: 16S rRNA (guanine(527)-N(7))-methyltransferase RsmG [Chloroflexi bacterium]|nr:MAG: 16S rRNA (guanine(527)-N(7))-methyltransferase RsmG [Chloroflexota bacterium]MBL1196746.1 16S rRNA (guanine(527)-N(7))-methyltransferase RsmG [Chloroflexota bacterium]NOH14040.1 16S rRNA (guanine(527)-N(7))-methyltransferase RsmG [Chloroflexota bacterium]